MAAAEVAARVSEACDAGEKFVEVFYKTLDKQRQVRWWLLAATTSTWIYRRTCMHVTPTGDRLHGCRVASSM